jgi:hypothetical protein
MYIYNKLTDCQPPDPRVWELVLSGVYEQTEMQAIAQRIKTRKRLQQQIIYMNQTSSLFFAGLFVSSLKFCGRILKWI